MSIGKKHGLGIGPLAFRNLEVPKAPTKPGEATPLAAPDSTRLKLDQGHSAGQTVSAAQLNARGFTPSTEVQITKLQAVVSDEKHSAPRRARAGVKLSALLLHRDPRPDRAEAALNGALELSPQLSDGTQAMQLRAAIRLGRGDIRGAQSILRQLEPTNSENPEVLLLKAEVQRQQGDPVSALRTLSGVRVLVDTNKDPGLAARLAFSTAYSSFAAGRPEDTLSFGRQAFKLGVGPASDTRIASKACQLLRELTCPDFSAAHRPEVEGKLSKASEAFQAGDWKAVQAEAVSILDAEPNEALAFHLYASAELRRVETRPLIDSLSSPQKQAALVKKLEQVFEKAGSRPELLFADWKGLNPLQQAKVAQSTLLFADALPEILSRQPTRTIHLVPPGESCTARDPDTDKRARHDAFGRHWYGTRGWVGKKDVVIGLEDVQTACHGGYDTVTHELSHLVQDVLQKRGMMGMGQNTRIALMKQGLGPDQVLTFNEAINKRFAEAQRGGNAQPVTDYAGTCAEEYFAESMMAAANPEPGPGPNAQRLSQRDPKMAQLAEALIADLRAESD